MEEYMHRFVSPLFFFLIACVFTSFAQAPAPTPKPDPQLMKLQALVGHWVYVGELKPGPFGPGGKVSGEYTAQWKLNGFILEGSMVETTTAGRSRMLEIDEYLPSDNTLHWTTWGDDGVRITGSITVNGKTITWEGKSTIKGKEYQVKQPFILSADNLSATTTAEISSDGGKTWTPWIVETFTKTPAAKR
jgi:hypothetical protein